jgi:MFS transporter, FSR family, fosmidomycin resistance protein
MQATFLTRTMRRAGVFVFLLLVIEFLDELIYGTREAAWPLIRDDLNLSYAQIGLLLGVPGLIATFIEPFFGVLGDTKHRRALILGGGLFCALASALTFLSNDFALLMLATIIFYPAAGAFVGLAQASLMDVDPARHEQNMVRWTLAGSLGIVAGPLALGALVAFGLGWRGMYGIMVALYLLAVIAAAMFRRPYAPHVDESQPFNLIGSFRIALGTLRQWPVLRWLVLLQFSDLMLDILHGYLALYFVDVVGVDEAGAGLAVVIWTGVGLLGDALLLPLLERVKGLVYLRFSAVALLFLYPAFLLIDNLPVKLTILASLGVLNAGWYAILSGQLYSALPGRSGAVMTVSTLFGGVGTFIPIAIGAVATLFGLGNAMWLLLLGPIALLLGLPRAASEREQEA